MLATDGAGPQADTTVLQGVAHVLGVVLILGSFIGPEMAAMVRRVRRGASREVVVVSRARPQDEDRRLTPMADREAKPGGAPAAKWVLIAGRILLAVGFITILVTDGRLSFPFAVAGVLSVFLAVRWAASSTAWERDYSWMRGLSTAEAALILGFTVGGAEKPVWPLSPGARRAIGVAMSLFIGAVLLLIGVGVQAGWL